MVLRRGCSVTTSGVLRRVGPVRPDRTLAGSRVALRGCGSCPFDAVFQAAIGATRRWPGGAQPVPVPALPNRLIAFSAPPAPATPVVGPRESQTVDAPGRRGGGPPVRGERGPGSFPLRVNGPAWRTGRPCPARSPPLAPAMPEAGPLGQTLSRGVMGGAWAPRDCDAARRESSRFWHRVDGAHARIFRRRRPGSAREGAGALSGAACGRVRPVACPRRFARCFRGIKPRPSERQG